MADAAGCAPGPLGHMTAGWSVPQYLHSVAAGDRSSDNRTAIDVAARLTELIAGFVAPPLAASPSPRAGRQIGQADGPFGATQWTITP